MIIDEELAGWISDREAQRATQARVDDCARRWRQDEVHRRFSAALADPAVVDADTVVEAVLKLFADHGWVDDLIARLGEGLRTDPFFDPPFASMSTDIHSGLLVYEDSKVSIGVGVTRADELAAKKNVVRGRVSIGFTGQVSILKFLSAGDAFLSFWEAPEITAAFTGAEAGRCRRTGGRTVADGELLLCDGRRQSYVIEHARSNMVMLQATVKTDQAPLSVEYDSVSHEFVGCSATSDVSSRIQMMTTLLRKLGDGRAFEAVAPFLAHEDFFVRWHVMRELLGIDAAAALPHLERMAAGDPHPDNRSAAAEVLTRFPALDKRKAA
jgi:hypothetical protein